MRREYTPALSQDFHSHILPGMDDGAKNAEVSVGQLYALAQQGIRHVVATPHFYLHDESLGIFLTRRVKCATALQQALRCVDVPLPGVSIGAEVYLERGLMEVDLARLRMADTDYVLFELPYTGISMSDTELIFNLCTRNRVRPLLAHLDRYLDFLPDGMLPELLSLPDVVVQINNEAFHNRKAAKFALSLIHDGTPVVFGSDTHDLSARRPNFDISNKFLAAKLKDDEFRRLKLQHLAFLNGKM